MLGAELASGTQVEVNIPRWFCRRSIVVWVLKRLFFRQLTRFLLPASPTPPHKLPESVRPTHVPKLVPDNDVKTPMNLNEGLKFWSVHTLVSVSRIVSSSYYPKVRYFRSRCIFPTPTEEYQRWIHLQDQQEISTQRKLLAIRGHKSELSSQ